MDSQENAEKWTVRGPNCRVMLERLRAIQRNVSGSIETMRQHATAS